MHPNARYHIDPNHGQPLPTGHFLRRGIQPLLLAARDYAASQVARGRPVNLSEFLPQFRNLLIDHAIHYFRDGVKNRAMEVIASVNSTRGTKSLLLVRKNIVASSIAGIDFSFDLLRPEVLESIQRAAFDLAQSTLATAETSANQAIQAARAALRAGTLEADTTRELNRRFFQIFGDPHIAARIAQTESARAFGAGAMEVARQSPVVSGLEWLASSDACPLCLSLNRKRVAIGEPFYRHAKPGPYQLVYHPPAHPNCFCTTKSVVNPAAVNEQSLRQLYAMASGPASGSTGFGGIR